MAKIFSSKVFIKHHKFHQLKTLANIIPNTEDILCISAKEDVGYFIQDR